MPHDRKIILPSGTVVRITKTNQFAIIKSAYYLMDRPDTFLHYYAEIEDREGIYALYPADFDVEHLPPE